MDLSGIHLSKIYKDQYGNVKIYIGDTNNTTRTGKPGPLKFHVNGTHYVAHAPMNESEELEGGKKKYSLDPTKPVDIPLVVDETTHASLFGDMGLKRITDAIGPLLPISELFTNPIVSPENIGMFLSPMFIPDKETKAAPFRWYVKYDNCERTFKSRRSTLREAVKWNYETDEQGKKHLVMPDWRPGHITQIAEGSSFTEAEVMVLGIKYKNNQWKMMFQVMDTLLDPEGVTEDDDNAAPYAFANANKPASAPTATTTNTTTTNTTTTTTANTAPATTNHDPIASAIPTASSGVDGDDIDWSQSQATTTNDDSPIKRPRLERSHTIHNAPVHVQ
jgi:hypothetical protein